MFKAGDKVKFINDARHKKCPTHYPLVETIGLIKEVISEVYKYDDAVLLIQWAEGSTSGHDCWFCYPEDVEIVQHES